MLSHNPQSPGMVAKVFHMKQILTAAALLLACSAHAQWSIREAPNTDALQLQMSTDRMNDANHQYLEQSKRITWEYQQQAAESRERIQARRLFIQQQREEMESLKRQVQEAKQRDAQQKAK